MTDSTARMIALIAILVVGFLLWQKYQQQQPDPCPNCPVDPVPVPPEPVKPKPKPRPWGPQEASGREAVQFQAEAPIKPPVPLPDDGKTNGMLNSFADRLADRLAAKLEGIYLVGCRDGGIVVAVALIVLYLFMQRRAQA